MRSDLRSDSFKPNLLSKSSISNKPPLEYKNSKEHNKSNLRVTPDPMMIDPLSELKDKLDVPLFKGYESQVNSSQ